MITCSEVRGIIFSDNLLGLCYRHAFFTKARELFDRMPIRSIGTLNTVMDGYSQVGFAARDLNMCNQAKNGRFRLDRFDYAGALNVCAQTGDLRNGRVVHGLVVVSGLARRAYLTSCLIDLYSKCGNIDEARYVFDRAVELDDVSWNSLFSAYVNIGWPEVATDVLVWMHRNGVSLNGVALHQVLRAVYLGFDDSEQARRLLHGCIIKVGLDLGFFVGSAMYYIFAKNGGLDEVLEVFDCLYNPSLVVFNAMIRGFSQLGTETCTKVQGVALRLYVEMMRIKMKPSNLTYKSVLEACIFNREFEFGEQIHAHTIKNKLEEDKFIASALIMMYSRCGLVEESLKCFESTPIKGTVTWGSMIQGYIQNEHLEKAMHLFRDYLRLGIKPCQNIISSLMVGSGNLGAVRVGEQIHANSVKSGLDQSTLSCNSQMFFYSNIGDIDVSVQIFEGIATTDVVSWSLMILSHALHGRAKDSLLLFEKMKEFKVSPKETTFLALLTACSHGGLIHEGFRYLESMKMEYGLQPNADHYAHIVDLLGRDAQFSEAEEFILTSNYNNDPTMWSALLNSCHFHGDKEWSIRAAEKLMELDPLSSTAYMLLYRIYSEMGKMSLAMRIRGRMRERGVNKETDVSCIEIGASVHSFVDGDDSHPKPDMIFEKLEGMLVKIKKRESLMRSHGEILAVAFGVISLPEYVPIRVMKNRRMCWECHIMLKLFSKSERRKIIVRDQTRIHCFDQGSCSCGDYW
ncbi:uncharacterized protein A4U43_C07F10010 [Asparagus officinalis]|uniref:DYW domain-containing protein n=1 Tax=Asparagus officinalis TaxID=4686 RepID=A0A5P1EAP5_ASPOF|nr:pentatricopeptide repeat-containing protein At3g13880-like [Asparagus officinalis]ONK62966.1 uncharacterized protein A4U43_C07F10010 [Asparagus officinalis]